MKGRIAEKVSSSHFTTVMRRKVWIRLMFLPFYFFFFILQPDRGLGLFYFKTSGWTSWMQYQTIANPLPPYDNKHGRACLFLERNSNPRSHCSSGPNSWTCQTVWLLKAVKLLSEKMYRSTESRPTQTYCQDLRNSLSSVEYLSTSVEV
jgi:hypothetical protein